jgi:hypothetical protein
VPRKYDVGYGKPPVRTRFKPGRTGNPKGRPPKSLNLKTDLASELSESITVRENGKVRRVSKQAALLKRLIAKALDGDVRAIANVLALSASILNDSPPPEDDALGPDELAIVRRFAPRLRSRKTQRGRPKKR